MIYENIGQRRNTNLHDRKNPTILHNKMKPYYILFPILVFLGGCSFGPSSPMIKLAYAAGFSSQDVVMSQYFFGWLLIATLSLGFFLITMHKKKSMAKHNENILEPSNKNISASDNKNISQPKNENTSTPTNKKTWLKTRVKNIRWKNILGIIAVGFCIAMVSTCYMFALQTVPAHIAVILLFQYTWMDIIIEAIYMRKLPKISIVTSVIILIVGTLLASQVGLGAENLNPIGVLFGLGSALFYAIYIFLLGKVNVDIHPLTRSLAVLTFALIFLTCIFSPAYFTSGVIFDGLWKFGLILGSLGCGIPLFLFAIGTPKISTAAATILSSSELPASIICAVLILSEAVTALQWLGVFLLFFGIAYPYIAEWVSIRWHGGKVKMEKV